MKCFRLFLPKQQESIKQNSTEELCHWNGWGAPDLQIEKDLIKQWIVLNGFERKMAQRHSQSQKNIKK